MKEALDNKTANTETKQYVTMWVDKQLFGIPVSQVQDVLRPQLVTPVPKAPYEVLGAINLRGRIVTVMDMRRKLGMPDFEDEHNSSMHIVVIQEDEFYSLVVDKIGDVMNLSDSQYSKNPDNLSQDWQKVSSGVYKMENNIMVVLDVNKMLDI